MSEASREETVAQQAKEAVGKMVAELYRIGESRTSLDATHLAMLDDTILPNFLAAYDAGAKASQERWIPVEERLPEVGKEVIAGAFIEATFSDGRKTRNWQQVLQIWTGEKWIDSDSGEEDGATHWQPLPAAPGSPSTQTAQKNEQKGGGN